MKRCPACATEKLETEFHKDRTKFDLLATYCKVCTLAKQRVFQSRPPKRVDLPGQKTCQGCKEVKTPADFFSSIGTFDDLQKRCKVCSGKRHGKWRKANLPEAAANQKMHRDKYPERFKDYNLKKNYGLGPGDYDGLLRLQDNRCSICGTTDTGKHSRFDVDHCHVSGRIRGLLCHNCNHGLGHFKDSPLLLKAAASYVEAAASTVEST